MSTVAIGAAALYSPRALLLAAACMAVLVLSVAGGLCYARAERDLMNGE